MICRNCFTDQEEDATACTMCGVSLKPSLTPFLDELDERKRRLLPDLTNMPRPSPLDLYFMEVADKHGHDLSDSDDGEEP